MQNGQKRWSEVLYVKLFIILLVAIFIHPWILRHYSRIWTFFNSTDFRIAYFPLGGYVKMAGEDEEEILKSKKKLLEKKEEIKTLIKHSANKEINKKIEAIDEENIQEPPGFYDEPIYKRICVVFAGPIFNILSAFFVVMIALLIFGAYVDPYITIQVEQGSYWEKIGFQDGDSIILANNISIQDWNEFVDIISKEILVHLDSLGITNIVPPILGIVRRGGPADRAGMEKGDCVLKIDGAKISTWYDMYNIVNESRGKRLLFEWRHEANIKTAYITPASRYDYITKDSVGKIDVVKPLQRKYLSLIEVLFSSVQKSVWLINQTLNIFYQLITRRIPAKQLGGPIAIYKLSTESAQWGFEFLIQLLIIISINLGLINLFPIPALDGGHIVIAVIEALRKKRFSKHTRMVIQQIGYAIIFLLIIFVTFNDITR
jgi:regulator of sigma E protease